MLHIMHWSGSDNQVSLFNIRQAGCAGFVIAMHYIGRLKGLAELRGFEYGVRRALAEAEITVSEQLVAAR